MADSGAGGIVATSLAAQSLGGSCAIVFLALHPLAVPPGSTFDPKTLEEALTVIFSTGLSTVAMIGHLIIRKLLSGKDDQ